MTDEEAEARERLVELGCKMLLGLFGFSAVAYVFSFLAIPQMAPPGVWLLSGIAEACGFFGVLCWYLWHTSAGLRMLDRIWSGRKRLTGVR